MKKTNLLLSTTLLSLLSIGAANAANSLYFDANVGIAQHQWQHGYGPLPPAIYNWQNGNQGMTYGADFGYQFTQHFAVEAGYYKLPTASFTAKPFKAKPANKINIKTNFIYAALRTSVTLNQTLDLILKTGLGKQNVSANDNFFGPKGGYFYYSHPSTKLSALFGIGLNYKMSNNLQLSVQYLYNKGVTSNLNNIANFAPDAQLFMAGIGYSFSVA